MTRGARPGGRREPGAFPRLALAGDPIPAARALIGARLVRAGTDDDPGGVARVGRIVEVEAYVGEDDRASHARFGRTARNAVMYGPPGRAYVYLVYGMYHCLNVVVGPAGEPAAVLVRAVEPLRGVPAMRAARIAASGRGRDRTEHAEGDGTRQRDRLAALSEERLASGPGLVAAAFGIDRSDTGLDLCDPTSGLRLEARPADEPPPDVVPTPRVGIGYAAEPWASVPWRFIVPTSPSISGPRPRR